ncbi:MAG TPA: hypothetical protein VKB34_18970 [Povalibacter sp.]|nr:hypothetical protein [Povalibacter sp.]
MNTVRSIALFSLSLAVPLLAAAADQPRYAADVVQSSLAKRSGSPLVDKVRHGTARFKDVNVAIAEDWVPATPCVSGPNSGAMGVHFVLPERVGDGAVNGEEPEALIYEPLGNGALRLVGVEFIVPVDSWTGANPPAVDGHLMNLVGEPNRYGLHAFYELHVWAWQQNPEGNFADWNTTVNCDRQAAEE